MRCVDHRNLRAIVREIVASAGSIGEEPAFVADNLVYANLTGHDSHGVGMLPTYMESVRTGELRPNQHAEIVVDHGAMVVIDGHAGYGQVIGLEATEIGIARAREHGVCVLATRNSYHLCRIGAWGERYAAAGLVSMHHVNGVGHAPLVTPYRGTQARYSTNPYCCTLPGTERHPDVVLDFATTVMAMGKIRMAKNRGDRLPDGAVFDGAGRPTNDPQAMYDEPRGSIRPVGDHKGYCLALVNELLAGALTGGGANRPETIRPHHTIINNMLSIVIDPYRLTDPSSYRHEVDSTIDHVKSARPEDPAEPVLIPGDPERETMRIRLADGIPIDDESWQQLSQGASIAGLPDGRIDELAAAEGR